MRPVKIGLFGIGLDTYRPQFPGLESRLRGCVDLVAWRLGRPRVEIVNLGPIDNPVKALQAGQVLVIGNTNSRCSFPYGARRFVTTWNAHGPARHCAVGLGRIGPKLEKFAALLGLEIALIR